MVGCRRVVAIARLLGKLPVDPAGLSLPHLELMLDTSRSRLYSSSVIFRVLHQSERRSMLAGD